MFLIAGLLQFIFSLLIGIVWYLRFPQAGQIAISAIIGIFLGWIPMWPSYIPLCIALLVLCSLGNVFFALWSSKSIALSLRSTTQHFHHPVELDRFVVH